MKFCLSCRQFSSSRDLSADALFCPHCGLSFGVRRCRSCKKKPSSPRDANHCVHCGGTSLTDGSRYLDLSWMSKILALAFALIAVRIVWIGLGLGPIIVTSASRLLCAAYGFCLYWAVLLGATHFFLTLVPGEPGNQLRKSFGALLGALWKMLHKTVSAFCNLIHLALVRLLSAPKP